MGRVFDIPWIGGSNTMCRVFDVPWVMGENTIGMAKGFDIPWVGLHFTIGRVQNTIGRGSIYHGLEVKISV
jgi:hypothetical protein